MEYKYEDTLEIKYSHSNSVRIINMVIKLQINATL